MIQYREVILTRGDSVTEGVSHDDLRFLGDEALAEMFRNGDQSAFARVDGRTQKGACVGF